MAIVNRSLDASEQLQPLELVQKGTVTASNYVVARVQRPCQIQSAKAYSAGLSGTPTTTLFVERFVVGTGAATFAISGALTNAAFATSGAQSFSLFAAGASQNDLQAGDVIRALAGGTNAALTDLAVQIVVKNVGDLKGWA